MAADVKRQQTLGIDTKDQRYYEIVWVNLSVKLRQWALENDYDSFVYENKKEGTGEDSYVTLQFRQISKPIRTYSFNSSKYMELVEPIFKKYAGAMAKHASINNKGADIPKLPHMFWAGLDPLLFWEEKS
ncbi:hypothetical protein O5O45_12875 [Hahella aquimaris]|uniref:hypothetical protein n=1 Tax=Hahella sp. HNIBRBA332 TaxID=3015983 RepID=UPI00273C075B|nr:hypothetical protein [Hahella sp. HNIBRBA332]WLQ16812.1 hypothetical protein O5O45_12875 [Hahella sp. HNIBRBA332]